jgi:hypothetical protein
MIRCRRGIEGMPLKLAVMALVMSLSMPVLMEALSSFGDDVTRERCRRLVETIREKAEAAVAAGPGNVRVIHLDEYGILEARLRLGGGSGEEDLVTMTSGKIVMEARCVDPRVRFNGTLEEDVGNWVLILEATMADSNGNLNARRST